MVRFDFFWCCCCHPGLHDFRVWFPSQVSNSKSCGDVMSVSCQVQGSNSCVPYGIRLQLKVCVRTVQKMQNEAGLQLGMLPILKARGKSCMKLPDGSYSGHFGHEQKLKVTDFYYSRDTVILFKVLSMSARQLYPIVMSDDVFTEIHYKSGSCIS